VEVLSAAKALLERLHSSQYSLWNAVEGPCQL
jgi:hypothetical protein